MTFQNLKLELIKKNKKFIDLVRVDGRSWQYLHKSCSEGNKKVLSKMFELLEKI
ncbi:hypothetical protein [Cetobacterium sp.]|uniref:hypothetical protein n=1 Tax=Cetobacterium sp. TaxID=2071632 RepID=UPI003EE6A236